MPCALCPAPYASWPPAPPLQRPTRSAAAGPSAGHLPRPASARLPGPLAVPIFCPARRPAYRPAHRPIALPVTDPGRFTLALALPAGRPAGPAVDSDEAAALRTHLLLSDCLTLRSGVAFDAGAQLRSAGNRKVARVQRGRSGAPVWQPRKQLRVHVLVGR